MDLERYTFEEQNVKYSDEFSNNFHEGANVILTGSLEKDNTVVAKSIGVLK